MVNKLPTSTGELNPNFWLPSTMGSRILHNSVAYPMAFLPESSNKNWSYLLAASWGLSTPKVGSKKFSLKKRLQNAHQPTNMFRGLPGGFFSNVAK